MLNFSPSPSLSAPRRSTGQDLSLTFLVSAVKDKAQHAVILDKATSEKLNKDVQSYRLVTVATLVDRLKINGSLARQCLKDLEEKGQIKPIVTHSKMLIYSTSTMDQRLPRSRGAKHNARPPRMLTMLTARAIGSD